MENKLNEPMPVKKAMKHDKRVADLVKDVESGKISLMAPSGNEKNPWTPEKREELTAFFRDIYNSRKN